MRKSLLSLAVIAVSAAGLAACAETNTLPPGKYESSSSSVSRDGTKTTVDKETNVYYDRDGNKKTQVKTESTSDPKGLFNKQKTESVKTYD